MFIAYPNGTYTETLLNKHRLALDVQHHHDHLYFSSVGIYRVKPSGKIVRHTRSEMNTYSFSFYQHHTIYLSWTDNANTSYVFIDDDSHNITIPFTPTPSFYLGLAVSKSGKIITSIPGKLLIYELPTK
jgi:hypothetical protein